MLRRKAADGGRAVSRRSIVEQRGVARRLDAGGSGERCREARLVSGRCFFAGIDVTHRAAGHEHAGQAHIAPGQELLLERELARRQPVRSVANRDHDGRAERVECGKQRRVVGRRRRLIEDQVDPERAQVALGQPRDEIGDQATVDRRAKRKLRECLLADRENDDVVPLRARRREIREPKVVEQQRALSKRRDMVRASHARSAATAHKPRHAGSHRLKPRTVDSSIADAACGTEAGPRRAFGSTATMLGLQQNGKATSMSRPVVEGVLRWNRRCSGVWRLLACVAFAPLGDARGCATDYSDRRGARPSARVPRRLRSRDRRMGAGARRAVGPLRPEEAAAVLNDLGGAYLANDEALLGLAAFADSARLAPAGTALADGCGRQCAARVARERRIPPKSLLGSSASWRRRRASADAAQSRAAARARRARA